MFLKPANKFTGILNVTGQLINMFPYYLTFW